MITPVQRIPRYLLLLKELIKSTPEVHSEYQDLQEALRIVEQSCHHVNNTKKDQDFSSSMLSLQSKITGFPGPLVIPGRKLLCKSFFKLSNWLTKNVVFCDLLRKVKVAGISSTKNVFVYLFNDILLLTSKSYSTSGVYDLRTVTTSKRDNVGTKSKSNNSLQKGRFILDITGMDLSQENSFDSLTLYFQTEEERSKLLNALEDAKKNSVSLENSISFSEPNLETSKSKSKSSSISDSSS
jgi:hypothetical protein